MIAALYSLAMLVLVVYGLNLLWLALRHVQAERQEAGPVPEPCAPPPRPAAFGGAWPLVTVQLPLYNEAFVAARLVDACAALDYPSRRLELQVLDDSTDETTAIVAERVAFWQRRGLDIRHVRRPARDGYKAGALRDGLALARGDYVALFDADFVPPPDFLRRMLPHFDSPEVGLVQARWGHLNAEGALLTEIQAVGLDAHFALEQHARQAAGCFINFNGTAGIWRRDCIEDAGGWQSDTLTEDLDLSYRAQLRGWRFRYVGTVEVPAELPADLGALRTQQHRWTKGAAETARKMLGPLWRSAQPLAVKLEGTLHLTAHFAFPFVLVAALLHAPLLWLEHTGRGPGPIYFAAMSFGLLGFAGFFLGQLLAQRALYPDWPRRWPRLVFFMAGSMGIAASNTVALWEGLVGRQTPFVRTPKYRLSGAVRPLGEGEARYAPRRLPPVAWVEGALALYCLAGLGVVAACGAWAALPFQALFALGFGLVTLSNVRLVVRPPRRRVALRTEPSA